MATTMKTTILQPRCLQWARERAGLAISDLADKLRVREDKIFAWEQTGEITLAMAEKLANKTYTPFGYLFLPEPPVETLPIPDFRTVGTEYTPQLSPDLLDTVYDALRRQEWYKNYLISIGEDKLPYVGSFDVSNTIADAAEKIRSIISWDSESRAKQSTWEAALTQQIRLVEDAGILVMRSGIVANNTHRKLSVSEFRGFALTDEYAPVIFINSKDAKAAQIFTLAHELVHIWLGVSGVSNLNQTRPTAHTVEYFCNSVAAELLVPLRDLQAQWTGVHDHYDRISHLTRHFKVSSLVILRRLHDAGYISDEAFNRLYADELAQISIKHQDSSGGDFYITLRARLGDRFVSALVQSTLEGSTLYRDAFRLLGVAKTDTLHELAKKIGVIA